MELDMNQSSELFDCEFVIQGCHNNCIYRAKDAVVIEDRIHERTRQEYRVKNITPICRNPNRRKIDEQRVEIYKRADAAKEKSLNEGHGYKTASRRWEEQAEEWRTLDCNLFEVNNV